LGSHNFMVTALGSWLLALNTIFSVVSGPARKPADIDDDVGSYLGNLNVSERELMQLQVQASSVKSLTLTLTLPLCKIHTYTHTHLHPFINMFVSLEGESDPSPFKIHTWNSTHPTIALLTRFSRVILMPGSG
jgi:hypothetical protein